MKKINKLFRTIYKYIYKHNFVKKNNHFKYIFFFLYNQNKVYFSKNTIFHQKKKKIRGLNINQKLNLLENRPDLDRYNLLTNEKKILELKCKYFCKKYKKKLTPKQIEYFIYWIKFKDYPSYLDNIS